MRERGLMMSIKKSVVLFATAFLTMLIALNYFAQKPVQELAQGEWSETAKQVKITSFDFSIGFDLRDTDTVVGQRQVEPPPDPDLGISIDPLG